MHQLVLRGVYGCGTIAMVAAMVAAAAVSGVYAAEPERSAGILYEVFHAGAAAAMAQVKQHGHPQLTVETVIRSNGNYTLDDVYPALPNVSWYSGDIYNVQPAELGFYCLSRARDEAACNSTIPPTPYFAPPVPDCPMASAVAARHASLLHSAGFDYIAVDITNWPQVHHSHHCNCCTRVTTAPCNYCTL